MRCEYLRCDYCGNGCECWNASCAAGALAPPSNFSRPERDRKGRYASPRARLRNGSLAIIESRFAKATVCRELSSTTAVAAAAIKKASEHSLDWEAVPDGRWGAVVSVLIQWPLAPCNAD